MFGEISFVLGILLLIFFFMILIVYLGWYLSRNPKIAVSPYTDLPLRKAELLPFKTKKKVYLYVQKFYEYDNTPFKFNRASFCRETGRIFPDSVSFFGKIKLDWTFLLRRHPGTWVSWGSLSSDFQRQIRNRHDEILPFQMDYSSENPSPSVIEPKYSFSKPGPLYVDITSGVLMGWLVVPETQVEVLIIQKPVR
ncbi:hypothetical protein N9Y92_00670 [Chlamydiales bacterium]|nr:hypothetical protein [Chlamydiales bacterium]